MLQQNESLTNPNCDADYQYLKCAKPLDFSYKKLESLEELNGNEQSMLLGVHGVPKKNHRNLYWTGSFWLSNNNLKHVNGLRNLTDRWLVMPDYLSWLDLSGNNLTQISNEFLLFPNLTMLYLHRNCIDDILEAYKLRNLEKLRALTLRNNPLCNDNQYRNTIVHLLPVLQKLDNMVVLRSERESKIRPLCKKVRARLMTAYPQDFGGA